MLGGAERKFLDYYLGNGCSAWHDRLIQEAVTVRIKAGEILALLPQAEHVVQGDGASAAAADEGAALSEADAEEVAEEAEVL